MLKTAERHCSSRLLIVDDDSGQLRTLTAIMHDEGFDVLPCATAGEALGHLKHGAIGVAIVDLRLPDLSGTQLLEKIREMSSQVRVVIHTGYGSFESAKKAVNLDAFAFVEKLSDPAELIGHVHRAFRDRLDCYTDGLEAEIAKRMRVEGELNRHRRHLEELVKERTVELTESNEQLRQEIAGRKRADEALCESEERLRLTIDAVSDGGWDWNVATGEVRYSDHWLESLGYKRDEVPPHISFWERIVHPDDMPHCMKALNAHFDGRTPNYECENRLRSASGEYRWNLDRGRVVARDGAGKPLRMVGTDTDITKRKHAEEALRLTQFAVDHSSDAIYRVRADGRISYVNRSACTHLAYTNAELLSMSVPEIDPDFLQEDWPAHWEEMKRAGTMTFEAHHQTKDGDVFPVEITTNYVVHRGGEYIWAYVRDITKRKRAEQSLREKTRLNQILLDALPCVALLLRPRTREIVASNKAAAEVKAVPGTTCFETWAQRESPCPWCLAPKVWAKGQAQRLEVEYNGIVWDAHWLPVSDDLYMHFAFDVTERKQAEAERLQLKGQLLQAQKMEAIGQLAAGVAHGFSNLLTVITGYASLARSTLPADHKAVESLDGVANAAQQAAGVIRSLLTFSQKSTVPKEPIELHGLVERSVHMLRRMLPAAIEVVTDPADQGPVWIHADGTQVQQVVMNLAVNARDAMPDGGTLRILVTPAQEKESQPVASAGSETPGPDTRLPGPAARLVVSDTGAGISPEVIERIFEPFFTTKPRGQGTGLGLAIVHGIVKDHAGRIDVQSEPGRGTRFTIEFPLLTETPAPQSVEPAPPPPGGQRKMVLLAEESWHVRTILTTALQSFGYDVVQASDGPSFLERFEGHRDRFRLLLVDGDLPMRNGLDCLRDIRATGVRTPAIVITGGADANLESELDDDTLLLRKPFQMSELGELAARVLGAKPEEKVPA